MARTIAQWKRDDAFIRKRMVECGIASIVKRNQKSMTANAQRLKENNPDFTYDYIDFLVLRDCIRRIITRDLIWLARWCTDKQNQMFIEGVHKTAWDFFNRGMSVVPEEYRHAGHFNYKPERFLLHNGEGGDDRLYPKASAHPSWPFKDSYLPLL